MRRRIGSSLLTVCIGIAGIGATERAGAVTVPTMTVAPSTNLVDGQTVDVSLTSFPPGDFVNIRDVRHWRFI